MKRKLQLAAAVALAVPGLARADDLVFTPTVPPTGDWLDPTQWLDVTTPGSRLPIASDRADIAGGSIVNFGTIATPSPTARVNTLYIGANTDGNQGGDNMGTNASSTTGTGVLNMSSGTLTVSTWSIIGQQAGASNAGTFNLTGGTYRQAGTDVMSVGDHGFGLFNISNGATATIDNQLTIGRNGGANGTVTISGSTSTLNVDPSITGNPILRVGDGGAGTLNVFGGAVNIGTDMIVGNNNGSVGTVNQSDGVVKVGTTTNKWLFIGNNNGSVGTYNITGGTLAGHEDIRLGQNAGSQGFLNMSGTNTTVSAGRYVYIGVGGQGSATLSGGATFTMGGDLRVGADVNGSVGYFTQTSGLTHVGGWYYIADAAGSTGTYNMNGGTTTISGRLYVAQGGNATMNMTAGTVTTGDQVFVAANGGSTGVLNMQGGTLSTTSSLIVANGSGANGTVNQSGGVVTANWIEIGDGSANATYNMSGGTVTAQTNEFTIGRNSGAVGVFNTSNTATINVVNTGRGLEVGGDTSGGNGNGTLNVTNGILTVNASSIRIGSTAGSTGVMNVLGTSVVNLSGFMNVGADPGTTSATLNLNDTSTINASGLAGSGSVTNLGTGLSKLNLGTPTNTATNTFNGVISDGATGQIAVTVRGGNQVFGNHQTYSGATTINAGATLTLGRGLASGSITTPTIIDNGTLAFNRSDNYAFTNQLSGTGGILVTSPTSGGSVVLANSYTYTGPTTVNSGTLFLANGTSTNNIPTSSVISVLTNGTLDVTGLSGSTLALGTKGLRGSGTVTGSVSTLAGTITPGNSPTIGTLNITGDLNVGNGTKLNYVFGAPGTSAGLLGIGSFVNVLGNLTLGTGLVFTPSNNGGANGQGSFAPGTYEIFAYGSGTAGGTVTGFAQGDFITPTNAPYTFINIAPSGTNAGMIEVTVGAIKNLAWTGAVDNTWAVDAKNNWAFSGAPANYPDQVFVTFGDTNPLNATQISQTNIVIAAGGVNPLSTIFNNNVVNYSLSNAGGGIVGIGGTGGIVKNGTGTVSLTGINTFSGGVAINAGLLGITNSQALGTTASITVSNGATLQLQGGTGSIALGAGSPLTIAGAGLGGVGALNSVSGTNSLGGSITLAAPSTIQVGSGSLNVGGLILAPDTNGTTATLTKTGAGLLNLNGNNTFGNTVINGGIVALNTGGNVGTLLPGSTVTVNVGGTLQMNVTDALGYNGPPNGSIATLNVNGGVITTISGARTTLENGLVINLVGGTMTSGTGNGDGNHNWTDRALINATSDAAGNPSIMNATQIGLGNTVTTFNVTRGVASPAFDLIVSSELKDGFTAAGLNITGGGNVLLTHVNTFSGSTTISSGKLQLGDGVTSGSLPHNIINNGGTLVVANPTDITLPGNISGTGAGLTKTSAGVLTLSGNNTYAGPTLIQGGTLRLNAGTFASQPGLFEGLVDNGTNNFDNNLANGVPHQSVQLTTRYAQSVSAQGSTNGGTFPNFPDNSTWGYSGIINISASAAGSITFGKLFDDGTLIAVDGTTIVNDNHYANPVTGVATLAAGTHTLELRFGQGGGGVGVVGAGLGGSGLGVGYSLDSGTTWLPFTDPGDGSFLTTGGASSVIPLTSAVVMSSGTTLDVNSMNVTLASLADAPGASGHTVKLGAGILTIGADNTSTTFSGSIGDLTSPNLIRGQVAKIGTGTLILAGNNGYGGATTLSGGTLQVGSNGASGSLGTGPIVNNASLVINRTGTLSIPGNISGTGSLSHIGVGTTTLSGSNGGYSGPIAVSAGTVVAAGVNSLGSGNVALSGSGGLLFTAPTFIPSVMGFNGNGANWSVNSGGIISPAFTGDVLQLTDNANGERRSAWYNTPQNINNFTANFVYLPSGNKGADGVTFVVQNDALGTSALGGGGGAFGYGNSPAVTNSVAIELNIFGGAGGGIGTALGINGSVPNNIPTGSVNLASGDPILVTVNYAGGTTITETLFDQTTSQTFSNTFNLTDTVANLVGGSSTAFVGFTGATGGSTAKQAIGSFVYGVAQTPTSLTYGNNISLAGTPVVDSAAGLTTTLTGIISGSGSLNTGTSGGTIVLTGANTYTGGTVLNGGTLSAPSLANLGAATSTITINHAALVLTYGVNPSPADTIRALLKSGYNGGAWNGTGIASAAAATTGPIGGLGYADGINGAAPGTVLVKYVAAGDINLSGKVTIADYNVLANNFNKFNVSLAAHYSDGDLNFDGKVSIADYNILANNFNKTTPVTPSASPSAASASPSASLSGSAGPAAVPANGLELDVNTVTGDVTVLGNNATNLSSLDTISNAGSSLNSSKLTIPTGFTTLYSGDDEIALVLANISQKQSINGTVDLGLIFRTNMPRDLTFSYGQNGQTINANVVYVSGVPEPTTLSLLGLGAAGLLGRRRRRNVKSAARA